MEIFINWQNIYVEENMNKIQHLCILIIALGEQWNVS